MEFEAPAPDENGLLSSVNSTIMNFAETIESAMLGKAARNAGPLGTRLCMPAIDWQGVDKRSILFVLIDIRPVLDG